MSYKKTYVIYILFFVFLISTYCKNFLVFAEELNGKILKVKGDVVDIDVGSKQGIVKGTEGVIKLSLTANGKPVVLDIAKIKVISVKENTSKAKIIKKTSNVKAGYKVVFSNISPTPVPTQKPTAIPVPTQKATAIPVPTLLPTIAPLPTEEPTIVPTSLPTIVPLPTEEPTIVPTLLPTIAPLPTEEPTIVPTLLPTIAPLPTEEPTIVPTSLPTIAPTQVPTIIPTEKPFDVKVEINSDPTRARVYLEGHLIGKTPLKMSTLTQGNYLITVTIDDLMWEEQITIKPGNNIFKAKFRRIPYNDMVYIPAGEFIMGGSDVNPADGPQVKAYLGAYYIDRCEVSMAEYAEFVKITGYKSQGNWEKYYKAGYENYPVVNVSWYDAMSYAQWAGKRLPTELEWEKAARGADGWIWPWGNEWNKNNCNNTYADDPNMISLMLNMGEGRGPIPCGILNKGISPFGVMDMAGNVEEWIYDWYMPYPYSGPYEKGTVKSIRGGSWYHFQDYTKGYTRNKYAPDKGYNQLGFRCVKDLK